MAVVKKNQGLTEKLFLVFWGLLPLAWIGRWRYGFEAPKVMSILIVGLVLFLTFWLEGGVRGVLFKNRSARLFGGLLITFVFASMANKMMPYWWGENGRWQGLFFFVSLFLLLLIIEGLNRVGFIKKIGQVCFLSSLISVALGSWQWWSLSQGRWVPNYAGRIVSSFGEPNFWADYLTIGGVLFILGTNNRLLRSIAFGVVSIGLWLARSRLNLFLFGLVLAGAWLVRKFRLKGWLMVIGVMAVALETSARSGWFYERLIIWQHGLNVFLSRWWLGYGLGSLGRVLGAIDFGAKNNWYIDQSHNLFLDMGLYGGVLGLFLFVWLIAHSLMEVWRRKEIPLAASWFAWLASVSIHAVGVISWVWFIVLIGLSEKRQETASFRKINPSQLLVILGYGLGFAWLTIKIMTEFITR